MNKLRKIFILLLGVMASMQIQAQDKIVNPDISYAGTLLLKNLLMTKMMRNYLQQVL